MTEAEKAAARVAKIAKSQELLNKAVNELDHEFYKTLLANINEIAADAVELEAIFKKFTSTQHAKVIRQFAAGILDIGRSNADYFADTAINKLDTKDYAAVKREASGRLLNRFGLNADGSIKQGWYIDSFIKDTSIDRKVRETAYKWQASGKGLNEFKAELKDLVLGQPGSNGIYSKYYNTYAYDTYQQADADLQKHYADKLGLKAFLYLGGLMDTSRDFCEARNGKVFLETEIADWLTIPFKGKPRTGYNPFLDRGGYNCRHHLNAVSNKMAAARRPDLEVNEDGDLVKKGDVATVKPTETKPEGTPAPAAPKETPAAAPGSPAAFKPAAKMEDAAAYITENKLATEYRIGKAKLDQVNQVNSGAAWVFENFRTEPLDLLEIGKTSKNANGVHVSYMTGRREIKISQAYLNRKAEAESIANFQKSNADNLARWQKYKEDRPELFTGNTTSAIKNRKILLEVEDQSKYSRWTVSTAYDKGATVVHEFGHKLQDELIGLNSNRPLAPGRMTPAKSRELYNKWNTIYSETLKNGDIYQISQYAASNDKELFAEAFTMMRYEPEKIPVKIKDLLTEILSYAAK